jgi:hypothetical protein
MKYQHNCTSLSDAPVTPVGVQWTPIFLFFVPLFGGTYMQEKPVLATTARHTAITTLRKFRW